jgi:hypothetical protein
MDGFWRMTQLLYFSLHLATLVIFGIGLFAILSWPKGAGKGLMLAALCLLLGCNTGYVALSVAGFLRLPILDGKLMQVLYLFLYVGVIVGHGLLLAALFALGRLFSQLRTGAVSLTTG